MFEYNLTAKRIPVWLIAIQFLIGVLLIIVGFMRPVSAVQPKCLYVSSYHQGYAWSDGVERGLRQTLDGRCELRQFDMDTKRKKSIYDKRQASNQAREIIESWRPDVVITSDDNAAKFLILPYYKDNDMPFVFSGINWSIKEYKLPFSNTTGIIEVAPIEPMLARAAKISGGVRAVYLGAKTLTEEKNFTRVRGAADTLGFDITAVLVSTMQQWIDAYRNESHIDFVIMGSSSGIDDWDETVVVNAIQDIPSKLTVTNHVWMMPFTMLGYTKVPEEHGDWAGKAALAILSGTRPNQIPVATNRKWDLWVNDVLITSSNVELERSLYRKAKKYKSEVPVD